VTMSGDLWPDDMRLSDLEPRGLRQASRRRAAGFQLGQDSDRDDGLSLMQRISPGAHQVD
jgi:hypothetical protein